MVWGCLRPSVPVGGGVMSRLLRLGVTEPQQQWVEQGTLHVAILKSPAGSDPSPPLPPVLTLSS